MTDLAKLAEALEEKPDSDGHCREAAALLRAAAGADVQGLMDIADAYGDARAFVLAAGKERTALESALRLALPVWRPIEEAPKDGTLYIAAEGDRLELMNQPNQTYFAGRWTFQGGKWCGGIYGTFKPTHWTLPPQPKGQP